jgi:hypothetical protein
MWPTRRSESAQADSTAYPDPGLADEKEYLTNQEKEKRNNVPVDKINSCKFKSFNFIHIHFTIKM